MDFFSNRNDLKDYRISAVKVCETIDTTAVIGLAFQIGIPNPETNGYSDVIGVTPVGRANDNDICPKVSTFKVPTAAGIGEILISYNEEQGVVNEVKFTLRSGSERDFGVAKEGDIKHTYFFPENENKELMGLWAWESRGSQGADI